jgi:hypothetical protein
MQNWQCKRQCRQECEIASTKLRFLWVGLVDRGSTGTNLFMNIFGLVELITLIFESNGLEGSMAMINL